MTGVHLGRGGDALARRGQTPRKSRPAGRLLVELRGALGEHRADLAYDRAWLAYWPRLVQLRQTIAEADDDDHGEALTWAKAEWKDGTRAYRAVLAFLFEDSAWASEILREALSGPPIGAAVLALAVSGDAELVASAGARLVRAHPREALDRGLDVLTTFAADAASAEAILLAWDAALADAASLAQGTQSADDLRNQPQRIFDLFLRVGTPAMAARVATKLAQSSARAKITRYFGRYPELAEAALAPLAKGRGKLRDVATTMLATLRAKDATPRDVAPSESSVATEGAPPVLLAPPWHAWSSSGLPVLTLPMPSFELPPSATAQHDREAWIEKLPSVSRTLLYSSAAAYPVAQAWRTHREQRASAEAWMRAFTPLAIYGLLPNALGPPGTERSIASAGLRFAWAVVGEERASKIVERFAGDCARALPRGQSLADLFAQARAVVAADSRWDCPDGAPAWPSFLPAAGLPTVRSRDGRVLSEAAARHLVELMMFAPAASCDLGGAHPGVREVRDALEPASLEALSWHVYETWSVMGQGSRVDWPLAQLALFGARESAHRLADLVRSLATERASDRAIAALRVLAALPADGALVHVHLLKESAKSDGVRKAAADLVRVLAEERGLTPVELEDVLVPDLGLAESDARILDFGSRRFTIDFTPSLVPFVRDASGERLAALPRVKKTDDREKAEAATRAFTALAADAESASKAQVKRLERAMCTERAWPAARFLAHVATHPLLGYLASGLVWSMEVGGARTTFRVAEDRSCASVDDATIVLPSDATVTLPHPLRLGPALVARWTEVFSDYEILQPFLQLARPTFALAELEKKDATLGRFANASCEVGHLYGLEQRGWAVLGPRTHAVTFQRTLRPAVGVDLALQSSVDLGRPKETPTAWVGSVRMTPDPRATSRMPPRTFALLSELEASELLRELSFLGAS